MKQLKFLMVAFTLLMGVSFTSCLNDDAGESMYDGIGYVRTVMGSYFVDLYGNTYHPTMASVTEMEAQGFKMSGTDLAQIAFKYVEDTPATKAEGGTFTPQDYRIKVSQCNCCGFLFYQICKFRGRYGGYTRNCSYCDFGADRQLRTDL